MHSEHISNLHPGWVAVGWLVAVAVSAVVFLALVGTGLLPAVGAGETIGSVVALLLGFFAGGFFVGLRWSDAPVLHVVAITVLSVLVWFLGLLLVPGPLYPSACPSARRWSCSGPSWFSWSRPSPVA